MHTQDLADANIEKIGQLFPNCLTERINENGKPEMAIDFDKLKQELSKEIVEGNQERYQFTWPGKREAMRLANTPSNMTLRPDRESSVDFDNTENLYIEGDNLEVLKLLREDYLGKVKMIYIDPPYNTGNDFVYEDDFSETAGEFKDKSGMFDASGNMLLQNYEINAASNGRFHTDWLSMIYPRIRIAKDLLSRDGFICISIDDNEICNLTKLCDEVFGATNKIACITREAIKGGSKSKNIRVVHDYVICYAKNINELSLGGIETEGIQLNLEDEYGKYAKGRELNKWGAGSRREDSPSMYYPIPGPNGEDVYPIRNDGSEGRWRLGKTTMKKLLDSHNAIFEQRENGTYIVYEKIRDNGPKIKQFTSLFTNDYLNAKGTEELKTLFNSERSPFDFAKPTSLIVDLLRWANDTEALVLDFFSGSGTTADAIYQINNEDGGKRKYILVQLPEKTPSGSIANTMGYDNICDIAKKRVELSGKAASKDLEDVNIFDQDSSNLRDTGFRVLKLDTSNMQDVYYKPEEFTEKSLFEDNVKPDRTSEDLLFQVMLECNLPLSAKIERKTIAGKEVFNVNEGYLLACFDEDVNETVITEVAKLKPYYFIMRDKSLSSDNVADNFEQIFNAYSKDTIRRIL